ncbi:MAG: transposase [Pseudomonadota bacterium]
MSAFAERFRQEGLQKGLKKGLLQGHQEGHQEGLYQVASNLLNKGSDLNFVQEVTGLSAQDMQQLRNNA